MAVKKVRAGSIIEDDGFSIEPHFDDPGSSPHIIRPVEENCFPSSAEDGIPAGCNLGLYSSSGSGLSSSSQDSLFRPREEKISLKRPVIDINPEVQNAFLNFAKTTGATRVQLNVEFDKLGRRTQQKKVSTYRSFMDIIATIMAGKNKDQLKTMATSKNTGFDWQDSPDKRLDLQLAYVKAQYNAAHSKEIKLSVLAQISFIVPFTTLQQAIPGISRRLYTAARRKAKQRLICWDDSKPKRKVQRYNVGNALKFVEFFSSPPVSTMLPSGHIKVKTPNGEKKTIPSVMRRFHDGEIINMYDAYLTETEQTECALSEYVMRKILKVCAAKKQKSLICVDSYVADGEEAFDGMKKAVSIWHENNLIDKEWKEHLEFGLQESRNYLKADYFIQLKMASRIGDLCVMYSLSDPFDKSYQATDCASRNTQPHEHDLQTDRIRLLDRTLIDMRMTLGSLIEDADDVRKREDLLEMRDDLFQFEKDIFEWKKHLVRAAYSNFVREEIIRNLQEGEAVIIIDYAQKYLPHLFRERQSDYYAKKGLSWHISHVLAVIDGELVQHTIVHLMGEEDQNSQAVIAILNDVFLRVKDWDIHTVTFRSDNAGYYKNAQLLVSLPHAAQNAGIRLKLYSFSESQFGKADADREAGRMKQRMNFASNQGSNIQSAQEMLDAITSGTHPLSGLTVVVGKVKYAVVEEKAVIPHITNLHDFEYDETHIKFWRHFNIGPGKTIKLTSFKKAVVSATLDVIHEWDHLPYDREYVFWMTTTVPADDTTAENQEDLSEEAQGTDENVDLEEDTAFNPKKLWNCPVTGCIKQFHKEGNMHNHVIRGKHKYLPEKYTLQEYAFNVYRNQLEGTVQNRLQMLENRRTETGEGTSATQPEEGWALRSPKSNKRYTPDMRAFLDEQIDFYHGNGEYFDAKVVAKQMASLRTDDGKRVFTAEQRLNVRQIASYYTRKVKRINQRKNRVVTAEERETESDEIIQQMNDETGDIEIEFEDEAYFFDEEYYNREAIVNLDYNIPDEGDFEEIYGDETELQTLFQQPPREEAGC